MNVISEGPTIRDPADAEALASGQAHTQRPARALSGGPAAVVVVAVLVLGAALIAIGVSSPRSHLIIVGAWLAAIALVLTRGFVVVAPDQARVLILFGRYAGTVSQAGLWWVNPFTVFSRITISLRARNFQSEQIKVNDLSGNPIQIAAVVVWRVIDTAKAAFDV